MRSKSCDLAAGGLSVRIDRRGDRGIVKEIVNLSKIL
jgi:hypothetical protein